MEQDPKKNNFDIESLKNESSAQKAISDIVIDAVKRKASDIFIEPMEDGLHIRYRIDSMLCRIKTYPLQQSTQIVSCFKIISNLDIAEHRFPQDGRFKMEIDGNPIDFRVSVLPTTIGERVVIRILDKNRIRLDLNHLDLDENALTVLKRNLNKPYGMILVCGPTGSGKTTTLYSSLNHIDSVNVNIITVEDPIEFQLEGINQVAVHEEIGFTFASVLRSALRQDPDIIMLGEIRDFETADIAVKASLTGHLVLSTVHTSTATGAIVRLVNMGVEPFLLGSSCLMTAAQALLRLLCENCKKESPHPENLLKLFKENSIDSFNQFKYYEPTGCKICNNTGYLGRKALIEVAEMTTEIREMLIAKETEAAIRAQAIKNGMNTLRRQALLKLISGQTSLEEIYRITI
ncbi:MAG: GspE/PulE family protein [Candidatus Omnitrophica bacterium]|nr:GspE/PulE family protein [Candidatus Omnitrophota bacterium]